MVTANNGQVKPPPHFDPQQPHRAGTESVPLSRIRIDDGTQTRARLDADTVTDYAASYKAGEQLPPVILFDDGDQLWMADGFHRYGGAKKAGRTDVPAIIYGGTKRDALLFSAGCNGTHGLRRSSEDKRKAVSMVLADPEWVNKSNVCIAEQCRVSDQLVATVRATLSNSRNTTERRRGRDNRTYKARKPRKAKKADAAEAKPDAPETVEEEMQRTSAGIESFCRKVAALVEAEMPDDAWLQRDGRRDGALRKFKDGCEALRTAKCSHVCPVCNGTKTTAGGKCGPCLGTGRMPKAFYDQAV
jgi:ParB-like nuclease domain